MLIFQDGRLESLLGFHSFGGITSWLPLFLFVVLFGLSMDYHVLILTRVREAYDAGMPTHLPCRALRNPQHGQRRHQRRCLDGGVTRGWAALNDQ